MTQMKKYVGILLLVIALLAVGIVSALSQKQGTGERQRGFPGGCLDQLTEEQREALNQIIEELRDAGATHEEIREAIQQFLEEQGIDTEECLEMKGPGEPGERRFMGCFDQLTEEQREALNQIIEELRDAGATPEEIREAIQQFLEEQGIDTEECLEMKGPGEPGERRFMGCFDQLTEEQREALNQIIEELRDAGATPEEIREAVQQFLEEQGIDTGNWQGMKGHGQRGFPGCFDQLTEEQREALNQIIEELRDSGATHEEIREAIQQFLEEQGIDTGNWQGMKGHGQRGFPRGCLDQLTEEQREALNQIIEELRDAGATPEEIREAVQQFLEEQGIDTEECFGTGHKRGQDGN